jgi:hypothetical protein
MPAKAGIQGGVPRGLTPGYRLSSLKGFPSVTGMTLLSE